MSGVGKPSDIPTSGQQEGADSALQGGKTVINLTDPAVTNSEGLGVLNEYPGLFNTTTNDSGPATTVKTSASQPIPGRN